MKLIIYWNSGATTTFREVCEKSKLVKDIKKCVAFDNIYILCFGNMESIINLNYCEHIDLMPDDLEEKNG